MAAYYVWLKGLHIVFMVTWFAGLFYLPRLFIYHTRATDPASRELDAAPFDSVPGLGFDTDPVAAGIVPLPGRVSGTGPVLAVSPNGKIPAIVDRDAGDRTLMESGAILLYLAEKTSRLLPSEPGQRWRAIEWPAHAHSARVARDCRDRSSARL